MKAHKRTTLHMLNDTSHCIDHICYRCKVSLLAYYHSCLVPVLLMGPFLDAIIFTECFFPRIRLYVYYFVHCYCYILFFLLDTGSISVHLPGSDCNGLKKHLKACS